MRSILKWSVPIVLVGAAVWVVLSLGILMPINRHAQIETPLGPIRFRVVVLPDGPVRIYLAHEYHEIYVPQHEIDRIYSEGRKSDRLDVSLPGGAEVSISRSEDGSWRGLWMPDPGARTAPAYLVCFFGSVPREVEHDPAEAVRYAGRWRIRAGDGTAGILDLSMQRDNSALYGFCSTLMGGFMLGGHADSDGLRLAFFDGKRAVAVRGRLGDDGTLSGEWWDWQRGVVTWTGERAE